MTFALALPQRPPLCHRTEGADTPKHKKPESRGLQRYSLWELRDGSTRHRLTSLDCIVNAFSSCEAKSASVTQRDPFNRLNFGSGPKHPIRPGGMGGRTQLKLSSLRGHGRTWLPTSSVTTSKSMSCIALSIATNSASVELRVLSFCQVDVPYNSPRPIINAPPV